MSQSRSPCLTTYPKTNYWNFLPSKYFDLSPYHSVVYLTFTQNWIKTLQSNLKLQETNPQHEFHASPYKLKKIGVQSADWFGGGKRLGFLKLQAEVKNEDGESLPGSVFLRGPSVGMMVSSLHFVRYLCHHDLLKSFNIISLYLP